MVALCRMARGQVQLCCTLPALAAPTLCCQSRTNTFWVQTSTERQHAHSGCGDHSHCLLPNCQPGQSTGILRNEQQTNNYHNFQAAYGNLSGQRMKALCLKTLLQIEKLQISLLFALECIALCCLVPPARSVPMARMLCAPQSPAPPTALHLLLPSCPGFGWDRVNSLPSSWYSAVFWI